MTQKETSVNFSLTDEIADIVRERILKGYYAIGEKIKENQVATELNVSRTPIREAFKLLENEGLIDYVPNRGCFAKGFTRQDVEDIYMVRETLEKLAIELAVERISDHEIDALKEQYELMEFYASKDDKDKVLDLNTSFHEIIYNSTGSRFLSQVLRSYKEYLDRTRRTSFYDREFLDEIQKEHYKILQAIKIRDKQKAVKAMSEHLKSSQMRAEKAWHLK